MTEAIITVDRLSKRYHIGALQQRDRTFREALMQAAVAPLKRLRRFGRSSSDEEDIVWALRDVSFEVMPGEILGIIGRNGAGKTTLLKALARITEPTTGRAVLRGRVGSLLEVGTGFHSELTGRENVYLSGSILGMRKAQIAARFDEIVDFAGVERFIDTPVKRYSSGMVVRLGFAVAAHLDTQILLVDEVLAVGDAGFRRKCLGKMSGITREGRTVLFVSHNMDAIQGLTQRCLLLEGGRLEFDGTPAEAISTYLQQLSDRSALSLAERTDRTGAGEARYTAVTVGREGEAGAQVVACGDRLTFAMSYQAKRELLGANFAIGIYSDTGVCALHCSSKIAGAGFDRLPAQGTITCVIPKCPLTPGRYYVNLSLHDRGVRHDWIPNATELTVVEGDYFGSGMTVPGRWAMCVTEQKWMAK